MPSIYVIQELNFSCDGTVTQWKVGLKGGGSGQSVNCQIWRSVGAGVHQCDRGDVQQNSSR